MARRDWFESKREAAEKATKGAPKKFREAMQSIIAFGRKTTPWLRKRPA
jgi:hypothetical protein